MGYQSQDQLLDFCQSVQDSYAFDDRVCGLDDLANGAMVKEVSREALSDSSRFKRSELAARLAEEPSGSMTLYRETKEFGLAHVLTEEGVVYSTSHPPIGAEGNYVFAPKPPALSRDDKRRLLHAA